MLNATDRSDGHEGTKTKASVRLSKTRPTLLRVDGQTATPDPWGLQSRTAERPAATQRLEIPVGWIWGRLYGHFSWRFVFRKTQTISSVT